MLGEPPYSSSVLATDPVLSISTSPSIPPLAPVGPDLQGSPMSLLKDVLPGEDSQDKLRLLASLGGAGHNEIGPWLQLQFLTHFFLCEKCFRPSYGGIFPEKLRGQSPLVTIVLWVEDGRAPGQVIPKA